MKVPACPSTDVMGTVSTHRVNEPHRCTCRASSSGLAWVAKGEEALPLWAPCPLAQRGPDAMQRTWLPPKRQTNLVGTKNDMVVPTGGVAGLLLYSVSVIGSLQMPSALWCSRKGRPPVWVVGCPRAAAVGGA